MRESEVTSAVGLGRQLSHPGRWRVRGLFALDSLLLLCALAGTMLIIRGLEVGAQSDVGIYASYAAQFWHSASAFHTFPREYPPLSILIFSLTQFPPSPTPILRFEEWMCLVYLVGWVLFYRVRGRGAAWRYAVLVLALEVTAFARFDLIVGLICVGALWAARRRSWPVAYLLLAVGTLLKVFPACLVPLVLLEQWRASGAEQSSDRGWRLVLTSVAWWGIPVASGLLVPYLLSPASLSSVLAYQSSRPVEIESSLGVIAWLSSLFGMPAPVVFAYTSFNYGGVLSAALAPLSTPLLVLGVVVVYGVAWRCRLSLSRAFLLCLGVVLMTDKVFSPQYMLWVLPIAADSGADFWFWFVAALLTLLEYPVLYGLFFWDDTTRWLFMVGVLARNGVLVVALARVLLCQPTGKGVASSPTPTRNDEQEVASLSLATVPTASSTATNATGHSGGN